MDRKLALIMVGLMVGVVMMAPYYPTTYCAEAVSIGTYWYLWYGYNFTSNAWTGGNGTYHWNHNLDIVVDTPVRGFYASLDNETVKWQMDQMNACGITFAIVSWSG